MASGDMANAAIRQGVRLRLQRAQMDGREIPVPLGLMLATLTLNHHEPI